MKTGILNLLFVFCYFSNIHAQTAFQHGSNYTFLDIVNVGPASLYPSEIEITSADAYLVGIKVEFPVFYMDGNMTELNLLLESPNGTKVMLMSDCPCGNALFVPHYFGLSSYSAKALEGVQIQSSTLYRPINLGVIPDSFPDPGPGMIPPGAASLAPFVNENPNGTWRLWVVCEDEAQWSYFSLSDGWELTVETSPVPVCPHPEPPKVLAVTDSTALVTWQGNGPATRWDIEVKAIDPDANFFPPDLDWANDTFLVTNLTPGKRYQVSVRSACPDSSRSLWSGPVEFKTPYTPCLYSVPIKLEETVQCNPFYRFSGFEVQTPCGTAEPNWIFRFVPPDTGVYWIEQLGAGASAFWLPDTAANCPHEGWKCFVPNAPGGFIDTLNGGVPYFLMLQAGLDPPVFRLARCPPVGFHAEQQLALGLYEPFSATFYMSQASGNMTGTFDLFYTADSTLIAPGRDTHPSETGVELMAGDVGKYRLHTDSLTPETQYRLWARTYCENGAASSAWTGPFFFSTATFCGAFDSVWFDPVTDHTARLHFLAPSASTIAFQILSNGQATGIPTTQFHADSVGQHFQWDIIGLNPETTYEVRLRAYCFPTGNANPWYSFSFKTKPGCFLPLQDIQCGENVSGVHFQYNWPNAYTSEACNNDWHYSSVNEALYRITAYATGEMTVYYTDHGVGGTQVRWLYKDATQGCSNAGFLPMDCYSYGQSFQADSGKTYLLLVDGFTSGGYPETDIDFVVWNCAPSCPTVDSIWVDAKSSTTATLRWRNAAPGATYEVIAEPFLSNGPKKVILTTDTLITLAGLGQSLEYIFSVRTHCLNGQPTESQGFICQLGEHVAKHQFSFGRCNPRFMPPGQNYLATYEVFELQVPEDGDYFFNPFGLDGYLYETAFDPELPAANFLLSSTNGWHYGFKDTVTHLLSSKTYYWVLSTSPVFSVPGFNGKNGKYWKALMDGPAPVLLHAPKWDGLAPGPHGKVPLEGSFGLSGVCADTSGWVHFYKIADDPLDLQGDALLLSLKTNVDAQILQQLPLVFYATPSTSLITNPPAPFVQNPDGWYEMNRFWLMQNLQPAQQIDADFNVRFYYTQADFENMRAVIESAGGHLLSHEAMYFHKINGFHYLDAIAPGWGHAGIPAAAAYDSTGYWPFANGMEATTSTWQHGTFAGEHYAEMVIHGFSGGGGGASVNGKSIFDPVSKTFDPVSHTAISIYPNPNAGRFTVELPTPASEGLQFHIVDPTGRRIMVLQAESSLQQQTLNAGVLPNGLYFLQVLSGEGKILSVVRFVKQ